MNSAVLNIWSVYSQSLWQPADVSTPLAQVPFTGAGDRMKRQRRILVKAIGAGSIKTYEPILDGQSRDFIQNLTKPAMDFRRTLLQSVQFPSSPCNLGQAADGWRVSCAFLGIMPV